MSYRAETIATTVQRLNTQYFLPAIQREFVWKPLQVIQLFDSILRGYPISSFLFWDLRPENRDRWQVYRFINNARPGGKHNELANTNGVPQLTLVLDGQQRLTSLLIGLRGSYFTKKKYKRLDNRDAWSEQRLYLNLLKDPDSNEDPGEGGVYYDLAFRDSAPQPDTKSCWFEIGHILNFQTRKEFEDFLQDEEDKLPDTLTKRQLSVFRRNLERLYRVVWMDEVVAYYTENEQDYDRVLDIFVRANEGGTKLSKSDLLLSMITSSWNGINARDEIYNFVDHLNQGLTRRNDLDKDLVMKACLVLTDQPVVYKVQNFSSAALEKIQTQWPAIKSAIERAVSLVNYFGIDRDNLTSTNALIPIAYYLFQRPKVDLQGSSSFDVRNASIIRRWLFMALLNGVFGGASDGLLADSREVLRNRCAVDSEFPIEELNAASTKRAGRTSSFDVEAINAMLEFSYGHRQTFLALSLLYDEYDWGIAGAHQDHIFPKSAFQHQTLEEPRRLEWIARKDCLGNLALLRATENLEKSNQPLLDWLSSRDRRYRERHLIPDDPELLRFDRFEEFLAAREALIKAKLQRLFRTAPDENGSVSATQFSAAVQ